MEGVMKYEEIVAKVKKAYAKALKKAGFKGKVK